MELESNTARQAYIQLLVDTQKKKLDVLKHLMDLTERQERLIAAGNFKEEEFLELVNLKEGKLKELSKLDDGFEQIYDSVKEELVGGKVKYTAEIAALKELIGSITDTSVKLQALERRNKANMEFYFSRKRKEIRTARKNNKAVSNYYKTMTKQHEIQSYFYDEKN